MNRVPCIIKCGWFFVKEPPPSKVQTLYAVAPQGSLAIMPGFRYTWMAAQSVPHIAGAKVVMKAWWQLVEIIDAWETGAEVSSKMWKTWALRFKNNPQADLRSELAKLNSVRNHQIVIGHGVRIVRP